MGSGKNGWYLVWLTLFGLVWVRFSFGLGWFGLVLGWVGSVWFGLGLVTRQSDEAKVYIDFGLEFRFGFGLFVVCVSLFDHLRIQKKKWANVGRLGLVQFVSVLIWSGSV